MTHASKLLIAVIALICVVILSSVAVVGRTQQQEPPTKVTARTTEVIVDATVVDKRNRPVKNLTAQDFVVYEDNVPQQIATFQLNSAASRTQATAQAGARSNIIMLLLDYSTTEYENEKLVRDATVKYVQDRLQPNDLMAVFAVSTSFRALTEFTSSKPVLLAALSGGRTVLGTAQVGAQAAITAEAMAGESAASNAATSPGVSVSPGTGLSTAQIASQTAGASGSLAADAALRMSGQLSSLRSQVDQRTAREMLDAIKAIANGVRKADGKKTLVVFSQGFIVGPLEDQMKAVVTAANDANLTVYCMDAGGLKNKGTAGGDTGPGREDLGTAIRAGMGQKDRMQASGGQNTFDRAAVSGSDAEQAALRFISTQTGGDFFRNSNDLGSGFARIEEAIRDYYLLTYQPKNAVPDGQFHSIRVEVKKPGLTVHARGGYYAIPAGLEGLPAPTIQLVAQARAAASPAGPLFVKAGGFRDAGGFYRVPVILETPASAIRFDKNGDKYAAKLEFAGLVRDNSKPNDAPVRFGGPFSLNLSEAEYKALQPGTISLLDGLRLPPGSYSIEVAGKDVLSGQFLRREQGLYLREAEAKLALSTVLLSNQFDKAAKPAGDSAETFLAVQGVKIMPSARCAFRNGDNLIFYFDVYNPKVNAEKKTDLTVQLALLKDGKRVNAQLPQYKLDQAPAGDSVRLTVARFLQLAGLPAGDYSLVVEVKDAVSNQSERASAAFSILGN